MHSYRGACVSIYSEIKYMFSDLDFIDISGVSKKDLTEAMQEIGFYLQNLYFENSEMSVSDNHFFLKHNG